MSICFIICSTVSIIYCAFLIRCSIPLIICAIHDVTCICCAFVIICSTFVDTIAVVLLPLCGAYMYVIICSDTSIIPTFCRFLSSVLSLYRVVYTYGVQTLLHVPCVHFPLIAVLSSLYGNLVIIYPQYKACMSDPSSSQPNAAILFVFAGKLKAKWRAKWSRWPASSNDIN